MTKMISRGPVRGSLGMSKRSRDNAKADSLRDEELTPEQHDHAAAYLREQARLLPGSADIFVESAKKHESEAARKRSIGG